MTGMKFSNVSRSKQLRKIKMYSNGVSSDCLFVTFLGSLGEKFYIVLTGCVSVKIPNPKIHDFTTKYKNYQQHLENKKHH